MADKALKISISLKLLCSLPKKAILVLIRAYQNTLSPDHGWFRAKHPVGFCRFYPSCSEYGYQVIKKRGLVLGSIKTAWRVLRCNPWSKGGADLPR